MHNYKIAILKKIEFVNFGPYKIIGKEIRTKIENFNPIFQSKYQNIPSLWKQCFSDGTFETLINMGEYCPPETPDGYEGYMGDFCKEDGTFTYLAGFFMKANTPVSNGFAIDWANYFSCEVYTDLRFSIPKNNGQKILILDFYIPCKKKYE